MNTVEVKYLPKTVSIDTSRFQHIEWTPQVQQIAEDLSDGWSDKIEDMMRLKLGAPMQGFHQSRRFARRMERARDDLERSELETLRMVLETFPIS